MKIHVYCILRNEAVLLPYFLRHYGAVADHLFFFDDRSTDGTRALIQAHPKAVLYDTEIEGIDDYYFRNLYQTVYKTLSRGLADWVICVDADEFVYHPRLREILSDDQWRGSGNQVVYCEGWNMFADHLPTTKGQLYEEITTGVRDKWYDKPCVFHPDIDILFALGRHSLHPMPGVRKSRTSGIKLLHYRHLGREYCSQRHQSNYTRFSTDTLRAKHGKHVTGESHLHSLNWYDEVKGNAVVCV